jgi:hypothetical protein
MPHSDRISAAEMRRILREAYAQNPERSVLGQLARRLRDPAMPFAPNGRPRPHPLWLMLGLIGLFALCVFLYFSLLSPQP